MFREFGYKKENVSVKIVSYDLCFVLFHTGLVILITKIDWTKLKFLLTKLSRSFNYITVTRGILVTCLRFHQRRRKERIPQNRLTWAMSVEDERKESCILIISFLFTLVTLFIKPQDSISLLPLFIYLGMLVFCRVPIYSFSQTFSREDSETVLCVSPELVVLCATSTEISWSICSRCMTFFPSF